MEGANRKVLHLAISAAFLLALWKWSFVLVVGVFLFAEHWAISLLVIICFFLGVLVRGDVKDNLAIRLGSQAAFDNRVQYLVYRDNYSQERAMAAAQRIRDGQPTPRWLLRALGITARTEQRIRYDALWAEGRDLGEDGTLGKEKGKYGTAYRILSGENISPWKQHWMKFVAMPLWISLGLPAILGAIAAYFITGNWPWSAIILLAWLVTVIEEGVKKD